MRILVLLLFLSLSLLGKAQTRRALVIGLGLQEDKAWGKINGDKDVPYVLEMLKRANFPKGQVQTLINEKATKEAIVSAFRQLASHAAVGDVVYVHFSGHGQQMKDVHNDETDGLDECWIPYDAYRSACEKDWGEKHLTDDEVNHYLNLIRDRVGNSGKILVVIDACHSGDATRGDEEEVVRGVKEVFAAVKSYFWGDKANERKIEVYPQATRRQERWITLSACESGQVNTEMTVPMVGKLTYALYCQLEASEGMGNNEFYRQIKRFINANTRNRPQRPVMTGDTIRYNITDILR